MDAKKPIRRGTVVVNSSGIRVWVYFRYERLPNFCYWYGLMGHVESECVLKPDEIDVNSWPYAPSLCASPDKNRFLLRGVESSGFCSDKKGSPPPSSKNSSQNPVRKNLQMGVVPQSDCRDYPTASHREEVIVSASPPKSDEAIVTWENIGVTGLAIPTHSARSSAPGDSRPSLDPISPVADSVLVSVPVLFLLNFMLFFLASQLLGMLGFEAFLLKVTIALLFLQFNKPTLVFLPCFYFMMMLSICIIFFLLFIGCVILLPIT